MLKLSKKLLALSVSAVLSASVLLSGCGKVEGDADEKNGKSKAKEANSISESADAALKTVGSTAQNVKDLITGEANTAYSSEIKLSLGKALTDEMGVGDIEDIVLSSDVKAKNGNIETIFGLSYGKDELITVDAIRDDETGNVYIGFEQLSPGYLLVSSEYIDEYLNDMYDSMYTYDNMKITEEDIAEAIGDVEIPDVSVEDIDEWLDGYEKAIKDNVPKGKDQDKVTGDVDGVSYKLDCTKYTVSGHDVVNIVSALVDEVKKDDTILSAIDEYGAEEGITSDEIIKELDEFVSELGSSGDLDSSIDIDVYYQDDEFAGFNLDVDDARMEALVYVNDDEMCAKFEVTDDYSDDDVKMSFSAKVDDGATDVALHMEADDTKISFVIDGFKIVDEESGAFVGTATFSVIDDAYGESVVIKLESDSSATETDLSADITVNGEKYLAVSITGKETKASDISVPSGNVYDITDEAQMEEYGATVDADKFLEDIKASLGDDLYNALFESSSYGYDDYDEPYNWDEYDWDEYDWGDEGWMDYQSTDVAQDYAA